MWEEGGRRQRDEGQLGFPQKEEDTHTAETREEEEAEREGEEAERDGEDSQ